MPTWLASVLPRTDKSHCCLWLSTSTPYLEDCHMDAQTLALLVDSTFQLLFRSGVTQPIPRTQQALAAVYVGDANTMLERCSFLHNYSKAPGLVHVGGPAGIRLYLSNVLFHENSDSLTNVTRTFSSAFIYANPEMPVFTYDNNRTSNALPPYTTESAAFLSVSDPWLDANLKAVAPVDPFWAPLLPPPASAGPAVANASSPGDLAGSSPYVGITVVICIFGALLALGIIVGVGSFIQRHKTVKKRNEEVGRVAAYTAACTVSVFAGDYKVLPP
jgi:hypothetical protein